MTILALTTVLVVLLASAARSQTCNADGLSGTCINTDTTKCSGALLPNYCPGPDNIVCCVTDLPSCTTPQGSGTCKLTSACSGTSVPGYCPGPDSIECCVSGSDSCRCRSSSSYVLCSGPSPSGWNRSMCADVAAAWVKAQVKYNWTPNAKQFISSGPGLYRTDCSGFVSAAWNVEPPGAVTQDFPCYQIAASELQPCDALLNPSEHVALFMGWHASGQPNVVEECGHVPECCGSEATCPGACGPSEDDCDEYCPGCPIQVDTCVSSCAHWRNGW